MRVEVAAELGAMREATRLALEGDGIGDQPAARMQRLPAALDQARVARPPPMKTASGGGRPGQRVRRLARRRCRDAARPARWRSRRSAPRRSASRSTATPRKACDGAHPLDGDRAAAGADIPQALTRQRRERPQRYRAHLALGELAVMAEGVVGQARHAGADVAPGPATHSTAIVLRSAVRAASSRWRSLRDPLLGAAHMLEHVRRLSP